VKIRVIINPAAGQDEAVLAVLNRCFVAHDVSWALTSAERDADILAAEAVRDGVDVVAVYGGDGTVSSAANGLVGTQVPMAILPGGTCNVIATELDIPPQLEAAAALACAGPEAATPIDTMRLGDRHKIIRIGIGIDARVIENSTRERKDNLGWLAYVLSSMEQLTAAEPARYAIEIDGQSVVTQALACVVANIGRVGRGGLTLPGQLSPFDGLLDVVMLRSTNFPLIRAFYSGVFGVTAPLDFDLDNGAPVVHCRGSSVKVQVTPEQPVQADGDLVGTTPIEVEIAPGSLQVILLPGQRPGDLAETDGET